MAGLDRFKRNFYYGIDVTILQIQPPDIARGANHDLQRPPCLAGHRGDQG